MAAQAKIQLWPRLPPVAPCAIVGAAGLRAPIEDSSICRAIFERKLLTLTFKYGNGVVEPYCFGRAKDGNALLRAYQVRGAAEGGEPTGWKLFRYDEIVTIAIVDEPFFPRPDFRRNDRVFEQIYCQL